MAEVRGGAKPDLLATVGAEIDARLRELHAAVLEYEQLLSAAGALEAEERKPTPAPSQAPAVRKVPAVQKAPAQRRGPLALKASLAPQARIARKPSAPKKAPARSPEVRDSKAPTAVKEPAVAKPARAKATAPKKVPAPARPKRSESEQAIVAALEHGSHTLAELAIVTGMVAPALREGLRGLQKAKKITKAKREGKAAYALAG